VIKLARKPARLSRSDAAAIMQHVEDIRGGITVAEKSPTRQQHPRRRVRVGCEEQDVTAAARIGPLERRQAAQPDARGVAGAVVIQERLCRNRPPLLRPDVDQVAVRIVEPDPDLWRVLRRIESGMPACLIAARTASKRSLAPAGVRLIRSRLLGDSDCLVLWYGGAYQVEEDSRRG
jgi:hypothetical protein